MLSENTSFCLRGLTSKGGKRTSEKPELVRPRFFAFQVNSVSSKLAIAYERGAARHHFVLAATEHGNRRGRATRSK